MLKIYLITVVFFLISCILIDFRVKVALKESGKYKPKKESKQSRFIGNLRIIIFGLVPIFNLIMGIMFLAMFLLISDEKLVDMIGES